MARVVNRSGRIVTVPDEDVTRLLAQGFTLAPEAAPAPAFDSLTLAELRQYAVENSIDLGAATRKADVLDVIRAAAT